MARKEIRPVGGREPLGSCLTPATRANQQRSVMGGCVRLPGTTRSRRPQHSLHRRQKNRIARNDEDRKATDAKAASATPTRSSRTQGEVIVVFPVSLAS